MVFAACSTIFCLFNPVVHVFVMTKDLSEGRQHG